MDVNRTRLTEAEQDWIDKYRAALDNTPTPTSRVRRVRNKLSGARRALAVGIKKVFGSHAKAAPTAAENSNLLAAASQAQTAAGELRKPIAHDAIPPNEKRGKRGSKAS
jgi:hypothetical protein